MRRSSDMPQGHAGPSRRRISSSEGWLGTPFTARWGLRTLFLGTRGVLWDHHHCPQAGRQLSCIPRGTHAWDAAPQQPPGGSLLPGMAQVGMCLAGQRLSKNVGVQAGALRGTEMEQGRNYFPEVTPLPPGGPLCPLPLITTSPVLNIQCWQLPRGRHHLPATTSSYLCAPRELPPCATGPNEQLWWEPEHQTRPRGDLLHLESAARVLCPQPNPTSHQYPRAGWHHPPHRAGSTILVPSEPSNKKLGCRQHSELPASSS